MKILLVEDDGKIAKFVSQGLREEGFVVALAKDGELGYQKASEEAFDVLILDVMLPKMDGVTLCRKLRQGGKVLPILMLTARDTVENRVEGLDAGADDYLIKPFSFSELLARIRALDRRSRVDGQKSLEAGHLKIDLVAHKVSYEGKELELTSREFALLHFFLRRKGHVLSRTIIAESVWGYDFEAGTNVIDVYVNYLRRKLKKITGQDWIQTVRSQGYSFEEPEL
jgi:DNA-binding response OmpR family regulator